MENVKKLLKFLKRFENFNFFRTFVPQKEIKLKIKRMNNPTPYHISYLSIKSSSIFSNSLPCNLLPIILPLGSIKKLSGIG